MQEKKKLAIEVDNVQKIYKLYDKPSDRMKEAFGFGKKTKHKLHYALKGVDMKIYQGETVGIIGTNGSGKSTILKIITGVLTPTQGEVKVDGRISAQLQQGRDTSVYPGRSEGRRTYLCPAGAGSRI